MKNNTVEEIVKSYFPQSEAMGYVDWSEPERVYIDGYFDLQGMIEELTQQKEDELREVYREILDLTFISKTHIEALAQKRGIDISDRSN